MDYGRFAQCLAFSLTLALAAGCGDDPQASDDGEAAGTGGEGAVGPAATTSATSGGGTGGASVATGSGGAEVALTCSGKPGLAGDFDRTISVNGEDRRFLLHVPPSYDPAAPTRLIVAMHGFTEGPEAMESTSHFDEVSDDRGFLVAYPEGLNGSWNGGTCCGPSMFSGEDDVAFIRALLDTVEADYCVDPARVHATGFSNGGFMTHRLGCELSDRIASIAVVSGQESLPSCTPTRPVPVLAIHGDADPVVPYDGNPLLGFPSVDSTIQGWVGRDGCAEATVPTYQLGDTYCEAYTPCDGSTSVELCTVFGGGHGWPGGGSEWTDAGPPDGFVATLKIADFFEAHAM